MQIKVVVDFAGSPHVVLDKESAVRLLSTLAETIGSSRNLSESIRIVSNFEEYYRLSRKRFEEFIFPPKDPAESLRGYTVVQKLRLTKNGGEYVEIVFDRRIRVELIKEALKKIGYVDVTVERQSV